MRWDGDTVLNPPLTFPLLYGDSWSWAVVLINPVSLINCVYIYMCLLSAPHGRTRPTSAPTRQLVPPSPPLHCPPTQPPQYRTGVCACVCVCPLIEVCVLVSPLLIVISCCSDSSSPNHQADPGSHGSSEVSLYSCHLYELVEKRQVSIILPVT